MLSGREPSSRLQQIALQSWKLYKKATGGSDADEQLNQLEVASKLLAASGIKLMEQRYMDTLPSVKIKRGCNVRLMFKMASLAVTWILSSNLWCTKSQRSRQIYCTVLPRKAYYSCQAISVCVAFV